VEKKKFLILPGLEPQSLGRPARSQSLYRLRYSFGKIKESFRTCLIESVKSVKIFSNGPVVGVYVMKVVILLLAVGLHFET
jgi:hypothetical protein